METKWMTLPDGVAVVVQGPAVVGVAQGTPQAFPGVGYSGAGFVGYGAVPQPVPQPVPQMVPQMVPQPTPAATPIAAPSSINETIPDELVDEVPGAIASSAVDAGTKNLKDKAEAGQTITKDDIEETKEKLHKEIHGKLEDLSKKPGASTHPIEKIVNEETAKKIVKESTKEVEEAAASGKKIGKPEVEAAVEKAEKQTKEAVVKKITKKIKESAPVAAQPAAPADPLDSIYATLVSLSKK